MGNNSWVTWLRKSGLMCRTWSWDQWCSQAAVLFNIFISDLKSQALHYGQMARDSGYKFKLEMFRVTVRKNFVACQGIGKGCLVRLFCTAAGFQNSLEWRSEEPRFCPCCEQFKPATYLAAFQSGLPCVPALCDVELSRCGKSKPICRMAFSSSVQSGTEQKLTVLQDEMQRSLTQN